MAGSRRLWSVVAIASFGLAAVGFVLRGGALQSAALAGAQADAVGAGLQRLLAYLAAVETAERGFAFTGREADAKALADATADVERAMGAVSTLASDLPPEAPVETLRMLVTEMLSRSGETARARKSEGGDAAMRRAVSDEDKVLSDRIRQAATEIGVAARRPAEKSQSRAEDQARLGSGLALLGGLAGLASILLGLWSGGRSSRHDPYRASSREEAGDSAMLGPILGTLDDAILAIDAHGKVIGSNQAADTLLGLGESGPGSRTPALYAPDAGKKAPPTESPLLKALKGQSIKGATLSIGRPNEPGSRKVSVSAKPVTDGEGRIRGAVMTLRDVTEGKPGPSPPRKVEPPRSPEQPPRPPEEAFTKVFEDAPLAIALVGPDGRLVRVNGALCRLLGYLTQELVGRDPASLVLADDLKREAPQLSQLLKGEIPSYTVEKRFMVKSKEKGKDASLAVRWSACAVRSGSGEITGALCFVEEIKEKKPEARSAKESQDMLRLVLDAVPVGVWVTDAEGRVKLANPAARRIWSKDEAVARFEQGEYKGFWADSGKRIEPDEWGALRAIATGEAQVDKAIEVQRFDGTRKTLLTSSVPVRGGDGTTSGAIVVQQEVPRPKAAVAADGSETAPAGSEARVEALSAIVPICPSCEKRRDDPAYWQAVRTYVREHRAELREATCRECSSRAYDLWGELIDEKTWT